MSQGIPKDAKILVDRHIHSVSQLEVLLYMRESSGEVVVRETISRAFAFTPDMASDLLKDLATRGFLSSKGDGYVYTPEPALAEQVEALAGSYDGYRVTIINLIFSSVGEETGKSTSK